MVALKVGEEGREFKRGIEEEVHREKREREGKREGTRSASPTFMKSECDASVNDYLSLSLSLSLFLFLSACIFPHASIQLMKLLHASCRISRRGCVQDEGRQQRNGGERGSRPGSG